MPKTYLKHFCERNKTINVFDKEQLKTFKANINDVACSNYFYDIDNEVLEQEQIFEAFLSVIEAKYAELIKNLLSRLDSILLNASNENMKNIEFTSNDKQYLAIFFVLQFSRTAYFRKKCAQQFKWVLEQIANVKFKEKLNIKIHEDKFTAIHLKIMFEHIEQLASYLIQQEWFILFNVSERPFYTSDNPAILDTKFCAQDGRGKGFISKGVNFYFPISPKYTLYIVESDLYKELKIPFGYNNIWNAQEEVVLYANDLQLTECLSQVYASNDKYFDEDAKYCRSQNICGNRNKSLPLKSQ